MIKMVKYFNYMDTCMSIFVMLVTDALLFVKVMSLLSSNTAYVYV